MLTLNIGLIYMTYKPLKLTKYVIARPTTQGDYVSLDVDSTLEGAKKKGNRLVESGKEQLIVYLRVLGVED